MLVLTRKKDEEIVIDGRITVKILEVKGQRVTIGVQAPSELTVYRREIAPPPPVPEAA